MTVSLHGPPLGDQAADVVSGATRLTVVVNPTKVDDLEVTKALVTQVCRRHGCSDPTFVFTTETETGEQQGRDAVAAGAQVVASLGGDGTVRAVASALVGTDVALGLLPGGTGNLLARNLGLDGEVMAGTDEKVQGLLGWPAHALAAAQRLGGRGFAARVDAAGTNGADVTSGEHGFERSIARHCRSVLVGNCGTLQGGVELMPQARPDDGILDLVVVAPRGVFGWFSVLGAVATRGRVGHHRLDRLRSTASRVQAACPVEAEIDGDPIGTHQTLTVRVPPGALVVRSG